MSAVLVLALSACVTAPRPSPQAPAESSAAVSGEQLVLGGVVDFNDPRREPMVAPRTPPDAPQVAILDPHQVPAEPLPDPEPTPPAPVPVAVPVTTPSVTATVAAEPATPPTAVEPAPAAADAAPTVVPENAVAFAPISTEPATEPAGAAPMPAPVEAKPTTRPKRAAPAKETPAPVAAAATTVVDATAAAASVIAATTAAVTPAEPAQVAPPVPAPAVEAAPAPVSEPAIAAVSRPTPVEPPVAPAPTYEGTLAFAPISTEPVSSDATPAPPPAFTATPRKPAAKPRRAAPKPSAPVAVPVVTPTVVAETPAPAPAPVVETPAPAPAAVVEAPAPQAGAPVDAPAATPEVAVASTPSPAETPAAEPAPAPVTEAAPMAQPVAEAPAPQPEPVPEPAPSLPAPSIPVAVVPVPVPTASPEIVSPAVPEPVPAEPVIPEAPVSITDEALNYLDQAFNFVQQNALYRDRVDWVAARSRMLSTARYAQQPSDTYEALRALLAELKEDLANFTPPGAAAASPAAPVAVLPNAQQLGIRTSFFDGIATVFVPPLAAADDSIASRYATLMNEALADLEGRGTCGWIVDLRSVDGGEMQAPLVGLGPLLGEGVQGYFAYPDGRQTPYGYWRGEARGLAGAKARSYRPMRLKQANLPTAVLIGPQTAHAGEAAALAFAKRPNVQIIGNRSSGRATAARNYAMPDGAELTITMARIADRLGRVQGGPIVPDLEVGVAKQRGPVIDGDAAASMARAWLREAGCRP